MLQGDAIREITLEGPGAGGLETASAVVADMVSVIGTTGTGFLQNDACWRELATLPPGDLRSRFYVRDRRRRPARRARPHRASCSPREDVSIARLSQHLVNGRAALDVVTHEAPAGRRRRGARRDRRAAEVHGAPDALRVIAERVMTAR